LYANISPKFSGQLVLNIKNELNQELTSIKLNSKEIEIIGFDIKMKMK
jgi:hypothetical protein